MGVTIIQALIAASFSFSTSCNGTSYSLQNHTLGDFLKYNGHNLLKFERKSESYYLDFILRSYSSSNEKFDGVNIKVYGNRASEQDIQSLKCACEKNIKLKNFNYKTFWLTERFCVRPTTVKNYPKIQTQDNKREDFSTSKGVNRKIKKPVSCTIVEVKLQESNSNSQTSKGVNRKILKNK